jgi:hypothetical protein
VFDEAVELLEGEPINFPRGHAVDVGEERLVVF